MFVILNLYSAQATRINCCLFGQGKFAKYFSYSQPKKYPHQVEDRQYSSIEKQYALPRFDACHERGRARARGAGRARGAVYGGGQRCAPQLPFYTFDALYLQLSKCIETFSFIVMAMFRYVIFLFD